MRTHQFFRTLTICAASALFAGTALADHEKHLSTTATHTFRASKIIGATAVDQAGQTIGRITDLIMQPTSGKAEFAVVSLDVPGEANLSGKYTAVPWPLVRFSGTDRVTFNVKRDRLASAPTFDNNAWPDFTRQEYNQRVYTYYGLTYPERSAMGGTIYMEHDHGIGSSEDKTFFKRPQPDGRETFPELQEHWPHKP